MNIWILSLLCITLVNISAYLWAYRRQSDALTDITYSFCFFVLTLFLLLLRDEVTMPHIVLSGMVFLWAIRLGGFLFYRIHVMGRDRRFDTFRDSPIGFLKFWLLQSVSIWILCWPVITGLTSNELHSIHYPALGLFLIGFFIESIADWQKFRCKQQNGENTFITSGLYSRIRHPNYLGEIMVWLSVFIYVMPALAAWQWLAILSPLWLIILLVKISGIPLIEKTNAKRHAGNPTYANYVKKTYRLIPFVY